MYFLREINFICNQYLDLDLVYNETFLSWTHSVSENTVQLTDVGHKDNYTFRSLKKVQLVRFHYRCSLIYQPNPI